MSREIKTLQDTIKTMDHKFDIINNRFMDIEKKIENIPSMIVPRSESIPTPVTPPVIVPIESVIPLTKPKDNLLNFLSSNRTKNILNVDGSFDKLEDQVLEITIYVNRLIETLKNIQSSKGLVATFTAGSKPFSGSDL